MVRIIITLCIGSRDRLTVCPFSNICLDQRKVFGHERKLFTREELVKHTREGDANDPSFKGHQECLFCQEFFYGKDELYEHLELDHEHCFICRKKGNFQQYFVNYASLVRALISLRNVWSGRCSPISHLFPGKSLSPRPLPV